MNISLKTVLSVLTLGDKLLIFFLVLISFVSIGFLNRQSPDGQIAVIESAGQMPVSVDLLQDKTLSISGQVGLVTIKVSDRSIKIVSSKCPQQFCVRQKAINEVGKIIVCVPNEVTIWIEGEKAKNKFDAVTG